MRAVITRPFSLICVWTLGAHTQSLILLIERNESRSHRVRKEYLLM